MTRPLRERERLLLEALRDHERSRTPFDLDTIAEITGYERSTVKTYFTKKIEGVLAVRTADDQWRARNAMAYSDDEFAHLMSQKHTVIDDTTIKTAVAWRAAMRQLTALGRLYNYPLDAETWRALGDLVELDRIHLWTGDGQWAAEVARQVEADDPVVRHAPGRFTSTHRRDLVTALRAPQTIWFGGDDGKQDIDGCREVHPGEPGHFKAAVKTFLSSTDLVDGPQPDSQNDAQEGPPPLFTDEEYAERDLPWARAWARLPVVHHLDGLGVRWVGPLVNLGLDGSMSEMRQAAYSYLESCGWQQALEDADPATDPSGRLRSEWLDACALAARRLADAGRDAGPESDPEVWASWLAFELSALHDRIRHLAPTR